MKDILDKEDPEYIFVHGDTTTTAFASIAAFYNQIKICHIEAGLRTFNKYSPFPEEINRKIVDHLSDINLPLSEQARDYLIAEGIKPETIIKTGSPMTEVLNANMDKILSSDILIRENLLQALMQMRILNHVFVW